jgi:hypothetical protein
LWPSTTSAIGSTASQTGSPNAIDGFELKMLGSGRIFERSADDMCAVLPSAKRHRNSSATPSCRSRSTPATTTSLPGTGQNTTSSGNAVQHDAAAAASARGCWQGRKARPHRSAKRLILPNPARLVAPGERYPAFALRNLKLP